MSVKSCSTWHRTASFAVVAALLVACGPPTGQLSADEGTLTATPRIVIPSEREQAADCRAQPSAINQGIAGTVTLEYCGSSVPCGIQSSLIDGALVEASSTSHQASTRSVCGRYALGLPAGEYVLSVKGGRAIGYNGSRAMTCPGRKAVVTGSRTVQISFECRLSA